MGAWVRGCVGVWIRKYDTDAIVEFAMRGRLI